MVIAITKESSIIQKVTPYIYVGPALCLFLLFFLGPFFFSLYVSFADWNLLTGSIDVKGLGNYQELLRDPVFYRSFYNTLIYVAVQTPLSIVLGLLLAIGIEQTGKFKPLFRIIFFLPVIVSVSAASLGFQTMFNTVHGPINQLLSTLNLPGPNWLNSNQYSMVAIIIVGVWQSFGYNVVLYMAGLKQIDTQLYEAASLDGSTFLHSFRYITLPLLAPVSLFVGIMTTLFSFQVFATVQILTNGGPNNATNVWVYFIWREAFRFFNTGTASAAATLLFASMFLMTALFSKLLHNGIHYR
jgi:ABC-type sugar transport system permease subunit